ncbi:MAG: Flagellar basal body rod protein FlgB [Deltaproteobacteria bacterium ADurb.Bin510]|nr:MAG: Flagellar basal body rod protein FlgB [Deltaproteobacteria bacterium ADurb.Bin510]
MAGIFNKTDKLNEIMNWRLTRQGVISSNLANIDTPGYKAKDVAFEREFENELQLVRTDESHLPETEPAGPGYVMREDPYGRIGNDGNTVDIDREMVKLAQNQLLYSAAAQDVARSIEGLKETIRGIS